MLLRALGPSLSQCPNPKAYTRQERKPHCGPIVRAALRHDETRAISAARPHRLPTVSDPSFFGPIRKADQAHSLVLLLDSSQDSYRKPQESQNAIFDARCDHCRC